MLSLKEVNVFLGDYHKFFICRGCLNSYASENMLNLHKPKRKNNIIMTIRTSNESHIPWKKHFHKNPLYFRLYADFEADNEKGKITEKDIILTQEDEEDCRNINVFPFCEKKY